MKEKMLFDISEVCEMLSITSRTLRFYEDKGLISSTREFSNRRKYSVEQIELIKKILVLRALGLNVAKIKQIQSGDSDLKQAIIEHKAKILATMVARSKEIKLLDEALSTLEHDGDIFRNDFSCGDSPKVQDDTVVYVTKSFISGDYKSVFERFSEKLQAYTPLRAFVRIVADTLAPLGKFVSLEGVIQDTTEKNVFYSYLKYENLGLRIKTVLLDNEIHGFWLTYCEL